MSDYIHRCGRTGRVGSKGKSLVTNFIQNPHDVKLAQSIEVQIYLFFIVVFL